MTLSFTKYQGTGNDFVVIDNRQLIFDKKNAKLVALLCDRKFGIGADGLLLLENDENSDFRMVYYNSDGNESTMCGNGGRCIVAFAKSLGLFATQVKFNAIDGLHQAEVLPNGEVALQMIDVQQVEPSENAYFVQTGSPHHVEFVSDLAKWDVYQHGKAIRESEKYAPGGTNVNFVEQKADGLWALRTFERGVEDETLSCGTGATAVALTLYATGRVTTKEVALQVEGGNLKVRFEPTDAGFTQVYLQGPAQEVFKGTINVNN